MKKPQIIGILGGGQLARLLALKAAKMGITAAVLSPSHEDPAAQIAERWSRGHPKKASDLAKFLKDVDVLTFESEFVPAKRVERALSRLYGADFQSSKGSLSFRSSLRPVSPAGAKGKLRKKPAKPDFPGGIGKPRIAPSLKAVSLIQDRLFQKQLLQRFQLKTAPFEPVSFSGAGGPAALAGARRQLSSVWKRLGPFVLKTRTGGYDGYGTFIIKNPREIKKLKTAARFFIAEKWIPFKRELAILAARNRRGEIIFFPLVETRQESARCLWARGPAAHKKLSALKRKIRVFLKAVNYEGVMAFELFDAGGELLVNELAPRVHNSGHYSLDGLTEDQFAAHLKAVANLPLKQPRLRAKAFAMLNLLGDGQKKESWPPEWSGIEGVSLYWYGKKESRMGRKMGHLNSLGASPAKALNRLLKARSQFKV